MTTLTYTTLWDTTDGGVDCYFRTELDGGSQLIGVEVKAQRVPADAQVVERALALQRSGSFERMLIVAQHGFRRSALELAANEGLGLIDLLDPAALQNWILKQAAATGAGRNTLTRGAMIIRDSMQALAQAIAEDPAELWRTEWRDLERVLHEVFTALGFQAALTRSGKDGGFDLQLKFVECGIVETHLVELKHWTNQRPGAGPIKKFISVTARADVSGGLFLSSSGFAKTANNAITEVSAPIRLGDSGKIVSLCKTYYRTGNALWTRREDFAELLKTDTWSPLDITKT